MSASLVGSEMCIRDSPTSPPGATAASSPSHGARARANPSSRTAPRTAPVSYTHLTLPTICSV
eukprot:3302953-Alexandrium_andersonii.AAC.1